MTEVNPNYFDGKKIDFNKVPPNILRKIRMALDYKGEPMKFTPKEKALLVQQPGLEFQVNDICNNMDLKIACLDMFSAINSWLEVVDVSGEDRKKDSAGNCGICIDFTIEDCDKIMSAFVEAVEKDED